MSDVRRTALVTGGNRGIGFEACRQLARAGLHVILAARDPVLGRKATDHLAAEDLPIHIELLDVADEESVAACAARLAAAGVAVEVLVNNAGTYAQGSFLALDTATLQRVLTVNLLGAFWACRTFVPAMIERGYGRVVNVSSGYGSLGEGLEGPPAYSLSKAALNAYTFKLAKEVSGNVKINALCPGWVRTRMGGRDAPRSVEEAVDTLVWLATLPDDGPTGGFFRDRQPIPW